MNCHECGHDINKHTLRTIGENLSCYSCSCQLSPSDIAAPAVAQAFDEAMGVIEAGDDWNTVIRKIFRLANPDLSVKP